MKRRLNMETYLHHPFGNDTSHFRCDFALWIVVEIQHGMCFFGFQEIFQASFRQKRWIGWSCVDLWFNVHHLVHVIIDLMMIFEHFLLIAHQIHFKLDFSVRRRVSKKEIRWIRKTVRFCLCVCVCFYFVAKMMQQNVALCVQMNVGHKIMLIML